MTEKQIEKQEQKEVKERQTPSPSITTPILIEIQQPKHHKDSKHYNQCLSHLHERKHKTPNQSGRSSPLKKCEKIEEEELEILDECDLEILDILSQPIDDENDDYKRNDIINWDEVDQDYEVFQQSNRRACPELMFSLV